jgi:VanZ family protein
MAFDTDALQSMRLFLRYWIPLLLWIAVIFVGSTDLMSAEQTSRFLAPFLRWLKADVTPATIAQVQFFVRKAAHLTEYAVLAVLLWRAIYWGTTLKMKMSILVIVVWFVCAMFAATDEFHQSFVPSRTATWHDVTIDSCGAFVGLAISIMLALQANRKS